MSRWIFVLFSLIPLSPAFGQLDSNSVTVTASRNTTLQADQAVFTVYVNTDPTATLNDVLTAVQSAGLTTANLSTVNTTTFYTYANDGAQQAQQQTQWVFQLLAPLANTKPTVATLTALQKNVTQANKSWTVSFSLQGTRVSQQLAQSQTCDLAGLLSDARTQAQNLATAGGRTLSGILALSTNTFATTGSLVNAPPSAPNCSATVKFALLGSN
jgi:hypothetical protein